MSDNEWRRLREAREADAQGRQEIYEKLLSLRQLARETRQTSVIDALDEAVALMADLKSRTSCFPAPSRVIELVCPRCGSEYLHQGSLDKWSSGLRIGFYCENCRGVPRFRGPPEMDADCTESLWLMIQNEKGRTELGWIVETPDGELVSHKPRIRDPERPEQP